MVVSELSTATSSSDFLNLEGIEYFRFEEDFMENNIRCIPMVIRFKMDKTGIKLKLSEWKKLGHDERIELAVMNCDKSVEVESYNSYLSELVKKHTGRDATILKIDPSPAWNNRESVPELLIEKLNEFGWNISIDQWERLTDLQRFALLKLCRPGHENKNFPKAMKEFKLVS